MPSVNQCELRYLWCRTKMARLTLRLALLCVFLTCTTQNNDTDYLLPVSLIPDQYEVTLSPILSELTFQGQVLIHGTAERSVATVTLNADGLNITSADVYDEEYREIVVKEVECFDERCDLQLEHPLVAETRYSMELGFNGSIRRRQGIYTDKYLDSDGKWHKVVMTDFQPVHARKAFPCFDEPSYKAQFLLRVARPQDMMVISNMPLNVSEPDPDNEFYVWDIFERTPPMSTYLLSFVISDYTNISDAESNMTVWAPSNKVHASKHGLEVGVKALHACRKYLEMDYDLPKLDHVVLPSHMFMGMESWGLIAYVMDVFYVEDGISTSENKLWSTVLVTHEVTHQWLGNLVTLKWWNFTWLNEGFATFLTNLIVDELEPTWRMMDIFSVVSVQSMLATDFDGTTHPLVNNVKTGDEILSNFDQTSYDKGAAIVSMVYHFLTPEVFRKGVSLYLINNAYSNVDDEDLWVSLEADANTGLDQNLQDIMYNWTYEVGYPLITVDRTSNGTIKLTQMKYEKSPSGKKVTWWIPLTYTTSTELDFNSTEPKEWFSPWTDEHTLLKLQLKHREWILFNIRQNGYYRVNYDPWTWKLIINHLKVYELSDIHPVNRAVLLDDIFSLAKSSDISYEEALNLSTYLSRESDYIPWTSAITIFKELMSKMYGTKGSDVLQKYFLDLVNNVYRNVSQQDDDGDMINRLNKKQIVNFACTLGNRHCETESLKLVYRLMSGVYEELPTDLKATILCTAVRVGLDEVWNYVEKLYKRMNDKFQRKDLIEALGCSTKQEIILRLLKNSLTNGSDIREEDAFSVIYSVARQRHNSPILLNFITENIYTLINKFGSKLSPLLFAISRNRLDEEHQMKVSEILKILKQENIIGMKLKDLNENIQWNERYYNKVVRWLSEEMKATMTDRSSINTSNINEHSTPITTQGDIQVSKEKNNSNSPQNSSNSWKISSLLLILNVLRFIVYEH